MELAQAMESAEDTRHLQSVPGYTSTKTGYEPDKTAEITYPQSVDSRTLSCV